MAKYKGFRADRLREIMKEHEVTKEEIAEELVKIPNGLLFDTIGMMHYLYAIIDGRYENINIDELFAICNTCNCSSDYLLGLSDDIN